MAGAEEKCTNQNLQKKVEQKKLFLNCARAGAILPGRRQRRTAPPPRVNCSRLCTQLLAPAHWTSWRWCAAYAHVVDFMAPPGALDRANQEGSERSRTGGISSSGHARTAQLLRSRQGHDEDPARCPAGDETGGGSSSLGPDRMQNGVPPRCGRCRRTVEERIGWLLKPTTIWEARPGGFSPRAHVRMQCSAMLCAKEVLVARGGRSGETGVGARVAGVRRDLAMSVPGRRWGVGGRQGRRWGSSGSGGAVAPTGKKVEDRGFRARGAAGFGREEEIRRGSGRAVGLGQGRREKEVVDPHPPRPWTAVPVAARSPSTTRGGMTLWVAGEEARWPRVRGGGGVGRWGGRGHPRGRRLPGKWWPAAGQQPGGGGVV